MHKLIWVEYTVYYNIREWCKNGPSLSGSSAIQLLLYTHLPWEKQCMCSRLEQEWIVGTFQIHYKTSTELYW